MRESNLHLCEVFYGKCHGADGARTRNPRSDRAVLYPIELQLQQSKKDTYDGGQTKSGI